MQLFDDWHRSFQGLVLLALFACTACNRSPSTEPIAATPSTTTSTEATTTSTEEPTLTVADRATLDEFLAAQRGKVVLVDYWSTSCVPCVEKLPAVLDMQSRLHERGLHVVTVSIDDPDAVDQVRLFLQERGASGQHFISEYGTSPQSLVEFEIDLVPHYRLYNRAGELIEVFEPGPDNPPLEVANIEAAVERLL